MKWYPLSPGLWILLLVIVALADVCTFVQRYVVPEIFRPITYGAIVIILFPVFFFIVRPPEPMVLAQTLSAVLGLITLLLIPVQDVIPTYRLSWKPQGSYSFDNPRPGDCVMSVQGKYKAVIFKRNTTRLYEE